MRLILSYTNFFGALFCHKRCHTKQTKAADKNGKNGKEACELSDTLFITEFFCIFFIHKLVIEWLGRIIFFENRFNFSSMLHGHLMQDLFLQSQHCPGYADK